jgi:hypothetical protein
VVGTLVVIVVIVNVVIDIFVVIRRRRHRRRRQHLRRRRRCDDRRRRKNRFAEQKICRRFCRRFDQLQSRPESQIWKTLKKSKLESESGTGRQNQNLVLEARIWIHGTRIWYRKPESGSWELKSGTGSQNVDPGN